MHGTLNSPLIEEERAELESVAASLRRTPRLEKLLRYIVDRYFDDQADQLTEYNIATDVFGRKKTEFIASEDAIARVETHRLRKKLTAFYQEEGRHHALQISIPAGTYVPRFTLMEASPSFARSMQSREESSIQVAQSEALMEPQTSDFVEPATLEAKLPPTQPPQPSRRLPNGSSFGVPRGWIMAGSIGLVVLLLVLGAWLKHRNTSNAGSASGAKQPSTASPAISTSANGTLPKAVVGSVPIPFRMIAGYSGPPRRDSAGDLWQQDAYSTGGWMLKRSSTFIARTSDPFIYEYGRAGNSSYLIPLAPGVYELHLLFMQGSETSQLEDEEDKAASTVTLNGAPILSSFDIVSDAMGRNTADERVFRDVSPGPDGNLHISLSTVFGTPSIAGIVILKGTPHSQLPLRIVSDTSSYTDHSGQLWHPDTYFLGGRHLTHNLPSQASSDPDLLPTERYGHFSYALPVDTRDRYTVALHFVELYLGSQPSDQPQVGSRVFRVMCNGQTLLDNLDIYKEAGPYRMVTKTFTHQKPTAQGKLNLTFEPIENYATISGIEVLDESGS